MAYALSHKGKSLLGVLGRRIFKNKVDKALPNVARICRDTGWMKIAWWRTLARHASWALASPGSYCRGCKPWHQVLRAEVAEQQCGSFAEVLAWAEGEGCVVRGPSPHWGVHRWLAMACWATGCPMEPELGDRNTIDRASSTSASAQASRQVCKGTLGDLQPRGSVSTGW